MKDFFDYRKPALWITASLAAASLLPAVLLMRKPKRLVKSLLDQTFKVEEILYQAPFYALDYTADEAPSYRLGAKLDLWSRDHDPVDQEGSPWLPLGQMTPLTLQQKNFDNLFFTGREVLFRHLRRKNHKAWQLDLTEDPKGAFYYLLQQKNGQVYLASGYRTDGHKSPDAQASIIGWLFLLTPA
ncbi:MAG TPA: hypothetical protein VFD14_05485 [Clostridia bacterium]|nr:hypothetical protein [Clostridia bacterium]